MLDLTIDVPVIDADMMISLVTRAVMMTDVVGQESVLIFVVRIPVRGEVSGRRMISNRAAILDRHQMTVAEIFTLEIGSVVVEGTATIHGEMLWLIVIMARVTMLLAEVRCTDVRNLAILTEQVRKVVRRSDHPLEPCEIRLMKWIPITMGRSAKTKF